MPKAEHEFWKPLGVQDFFVLLALLSLTAVQMPSFCNDPGVGWHLETGAWIAQQAAVPQTDPFLVGGVDRSWIADQWLSDLGFHVLYATGGWSLLYAVLTCIYFSTFFLILYPGVRRLSKCCLAASFAVLVAFKLGQVHFILRPALIGFFFFSITYVLLGHILSQWRQHPADAQGVLWRRAPLLVGIFLLWANMHPSFVLGLLLLSLLPLSVILDGILFREDSTSCKSFLTSLLVIWILCCAATLLNPYGWRLHESVLLLGQSDYFMNLHEEWRSPNFKLYEGFLVEIAVGVMALGFFLGRSKAIAWRSFEFLSVLGFLHLGLEAVRVLPYFGIVACVPLAQAFLSCAESKLFSEWRLGRRLAKAFSFLEKREQRSHAGLFPSYVLVLFVMVGTLAWNTVGFYEGPFGPARDKFPVEALTKLKAQSASTPQALLAPPEWGGIITFIGKETLRAFIDDRNTLLGEEYYRRFYESLRPGADWYGYGKELGATHLLLPREDSLARTIVQNDSLRVEYQDDLAILFVMGEK